jgi:hypothetical protein
MVSGNSLSPASSDYIYGLGGEFEGKVISPVRGVVGGGTIILSSIRGSNNIIITLSLYVNPCPLYPDLFDYFRECTKTVV